MQWIPEPEWAGQDAYVIGGGDSLREFDWELLRGKNTIGCNSAFILGHEIVKITIFGDKRWWEEIGHEGTAEYGGRVVGCCPKLRNHDCPWLLWMPRQMTQSLGTEALCWPGNTGGAAINLALILGAKRVFLLGFDMKMGADDKPNWHDVRYQAGSAKVYARFKRDISSHILPSLPSVFPGCEVINISDCSELEGFPIVGIEDHFREVAHVG